MAAKKTTAKKIVIVGNVLVLAERPLPSLPVTTQAVVWNSGVDEFIAGETAGISPYRVLEETTRFVPQNTYFSRVYPNGEFDGNVMATMIRLIDDGFTNVRAVDEYTRDTLKDGFTKPELTKLRKALNIPAPEVVKTAKPRTRKAPVRKAA